MTIEVKPETELLIRQEIERGHIHSIDELRGWDSLICVARLA